MVQLMESLSHRVLARIRHEMRDKKISQPDLAGMLHCSQSRISKILTEAAKLKVDTLGDLCQIVGLAVTEVVRDRGMEFVAEMTPTELRILEHIRGMSPRARQGLELLFEIAHVPGRTAKDEPPTKKR